jgi:quinol monooxygenase YgiN
MSIDFIATWQAKSGRAAELTRILVQVVGETRAYEGCERIEIYQVPDDENQLVLIERWRGQEDFAAYQAWRAGTGVREQLRDLMAVPPAVRAVSALDV